MVVADADQARARVDGGKWRQRRVGDSSGYDEADEDRGAGEKQGPPHSPLHLVLQENSRYTDANLSEGFAITQQGQANVVDLGRTVNDFELLADAAVDEGSKVLAMR